MSGAGPEGSLGRWSLFICLQLGVCSQEELAGVRMGTLDSSLVPPEAGLRKMASLCVWSEFQKCQAHPCIQGKDGDGDAGEQ